MISTSIYRKITTRIGNVQTSCLRFVSIIRRLVEGLGSQNFAFAPESNASLSINETEESERLSAPIQGGGRYFPTVPIIHLLFEIILSYCEIALWSIWSSGHLTEETVFTFLKTRFPNWLTLFRVYTFCSDFVCYVRNIFEYIMDNG